MDTQRLQTKSNLSVHEAAQLLAGETTAVRDAERILSHAIESGELPADIVRWATEQWDGERLEGNIDRMRTHVQRADLDRWLERTGRAI